LYEKCALVAETADNLRFHHAMNSKAKLRTFASFFYRASSWNRPRKVVARLECSLQPVPGETGMRQEVDIRYVVTSLEGTAQHLYQDVYCQRGQMENLIKLQKAHWPPIACRVTARPPIRSGSFFTPPRFG
jgi:Transposase DDE domain group 1